MYYRFGIEGTGTNFNPIGLVKAETREEAVTKIKDWESKQSLVTLKSYLCPQDQANDVHPHVCLDYDVNNYIQIVI